MQMEVVPPLQSMYVFMVVSENLTSLVPGGTEDRHMKKPWWERLTHKCGLGTILFYPVTLVFPYTSGAHCYDVPHGVAD